MKHGYTGRVLACYPPKYVCECGFEGRREAMDAHLRDQQQIEGEEAYRTACGGSGA